MHRSRNPVRYRHGLIAGDHRARVRPHQARGFRAEIEPIRAWVQRELDPVGLSPSQKQGHPSHLALDGHPYLHHGKVRHRCHAQTIGGRTLDQLRPGGITDEHGHVGKPRSVLVMQRHLQRGPERRRSRHQGYQPEQQHQQHTSSPPPPHHRLLS
ncbi:MAG: hypothetical protein EOM10_10695 [Opitutae bacterium]|nr:hypothetical protein [Opitutae bacterium]